MPAGGNLWAIVLAGGKGRRLRSVVASILGRPLPKQFCAFHGGRSLLQLTMRRVLPLVPPRRCVVVVAAEHRPIAQEQLRDFRGVEIVDQPLDRGTAAGVLLPLTHVLAADPDARVLLLPSDHAFEDEGIFVRGIDEADRAIGRQLASVVLFGVQASVPHGDYGWIGVGQPVDGARGSRLRRVTGFWEKPGLDAERLWQRGALWNTMILLARGRALRELYSRHLVDLASSFRAYGMVPKDEKAAFLANAYERLRPADFSRDLVGRAEGLAAYSWPGGIGWTDLGTPERLQAWLNGTATDGEGEVRIDGDRLQAL